LRCLRVAPVATCGGGLSILRRACRPPHFAAVWRHRTIDLVTSPGAVRFAPRRCSLRDAAAFPRDSFPSDGLAVSTPREQCSTRDPLRPSAGRANSSIARSDTLSSENDFHCASKRMWASMGQAPFSAPSEFHWSPRASIRGFGRVPSRKRLGTNFSPG
jgi:hypothetical protein